MPDFISLRGVSNTLYYTIEPSNWIKIALLGLFSIGKYNFHTNRKRFQTCSISLTKLTTINHGYPKCQGNSDISFSSR